METTRICNKCNEEKPIERFEIQPAGTYRKKACRKCVNSQIERNKKRKKYLELVTGIKFKKRKWFREKITTFSDDPVKALRERDIKEE